MNRSYRVTTDWVCAQVAVKDGMITETAPILRKFKGQPLSNLIEWMQDKSKHFKIEELHSR